MNCCPSQRPKCGEWHERYRNLEDAATVTGLTISRESPYPALRNIGCKRGSEMDFLDHQFHNRRCGISLDHSGCCNVSDWARLRAQRFAKTRSDINHEMLSFEIAQRGNFVVVMFRVKPTIKVARFHRKGVVCNPVGDNGGLCARAQIQSRSIGQLYVRTLRSRRYQRHL